jgi:hypothetical protein
MKITVITILFTLGVALPFAANAQSPPTPAPSAKITAAGVWQPPQDVFTKVSHACQVGAGPMSFSQCYMNQLAAQGEPPDAVQFTRWLYEHFDQNVGIMTAFKSFAPVDAAQVMIPLRANDNYALLLVNGDPSIVNLDDLQKLDRKAMEADPQFQSIKQKFPQTDLWPGDRSGNNPWPEVKSLPGGTEFIVSYPLINGCHACARVGVAQFGWNFDPSGKFQGTTYVSTTPPTKP